MKATLPFALVGFRWLLPLIAVLPACGSPAEVSRQADTATAVDDSSFFGVCTAFKAGQLDPGRGITVSALLSLVPTTTACVDAEEALRSHFLVTPAIPEGAAARYVLDLSYRGTIKDLRPLKYFNYVNGVRLRGNAIADVGILQEFPNIDEIDLAQNRIMDITPLSPLGHVRSVDLSGNLIADLSDFPGINTLVSLDVSDNKLQRLDGISGHVGLLALRAAHQFDALSGQATLAGAALADDLFPHIGALTSLNLDDNPQIGTLAFAQRFAALESLSVRGTGVADISALASLPALVLLDISGTQVGDAALAAVAAAPVQYLLAGGNQQISSLAPLAGWTQLRAVAVDQTKVTDLAPLAHLTALTYLDLTGSKVAVPGPGFSALTRVLVADATVAGACPFTAAHLCVSANPGTDDLARLLFDVSVP